MNISRNIFFLLGLTALSLAENFCPPKQIGSFCTCSHGEFINAIGTKVVCRDIKDPSTLLKEIRNFQGYKIDFLLLLNLELPYLPPGLFLNSHVKELIFKDSILDNLYSTKNYKPSPFEGLENSLEELAIYSTRDPSNWYWPDLTGFKQLKNIEFVESPINFVGHVFAEIGGGSVESITAAYSRVYRIHPQAFPEMTNLKEVNFRGNFLPYMDRTMFPNPAPQLRRIDLSDNNLFTLPENMFDNMPALEFLDLSQNEFKTFQNLPVYSTLKSFYISQNPFECGCHVLPLKKLLTPEYTDIDKVTCRSPGSHRKALIKDIPEDELCF